MSPFKSEAHICRHWQILHNHQAPVGPTTWHAQLFATSHIVVLKGCHLFVFLKGIVSNAYPVVVSQQCVFQTWGFIHNFPVHNLPLISWEYNLARTLAFMGEHAGIKISLPSLSFQFCLFACFFPSCSLKKKTHCLALLWLKVESENFPQTFRRKKGLLWGASKLSALEKFGRNLQELETLEKKSATSDFPSSGRNVVPDPFHSTLQNLGLQWNQMSAFFRAELKTRSPLHFLLSSFVSFKLTLQCIQEHNTREGKQRWDVRKGKNSPFPSKWMPMDSHLICSLLDNS